MEENHTLFTVLLWAIVSVDAGALPWVAGVKIQLSGSPRVGQVGFTEVPCLAFLKGALSLRYRSDGASSLCKPISFSSLPGSG